MNFQLKPTKPTANSHYIKYQTEIMILVNMQKGFNGHEQNIPYDDIVVIFIVIHINEKFKFHLYINIS